MASVTTAPGPSIDAKRTSRTTSGLLTTAAMASLGAGAIHAAAVGVHSEHPQAVRAFVAVAAVQLGFGALALVRRSRALGVGLAVANALAFGGWVLAKTSGISFVDGLDVSEPIQWADGAAAALALVAMLVAARYAIGGGTGDRSDAADHEASTGFGAPGPRRSGRWALNAVGVVVAVVTLSSMVAAGSHDHAGHDDHAAGAHDQAAGSHDQAASSSHEHGGTEVGSAASADAPGDHAADPGAHAGHTGTPAAVAAAPYDPKLPIDLGGVDGVTPEQQARAENLVAITLIRLPHFADYRTAEAEGYHSIGDGFTGHEHFINWDTLEDGQVLNPDKPEALVYDTSDGGRRLVSVMFMLAPGATLDKVPDIGGKLTQWHIHDDLCFSRDPTAPVVAGITSVGGSCPAGLQKLTPVPMIHVWIEPNPCGPFSALEGIGAGQVKAGEEQACDHVHGA